jgi:hypothetical protein
MELKMRCECLKHTPSEKTEQFDQFDLTTGHVLRGVQLWELMNSEEIIKIVILVKSHFIICECIVIEYMVAEFAYIFDVFF